MNPLWRAVGLLPEGAQLFIKRHSSARLRYWLRQHFGADAAAIPDRLWTVPDGRRFHIGPDAAYWPLYLGLGYEPETTSVTAALLRPGDVVVDVGANIGWFTTLFARGVGPAGRVYAFEPVPSTHDRLLEHLDLNHVRERVTAVPAALGDRAGSAFLYRPRAGSHAYASLTALGGAADEGVEAPIMRLDEYLSGQGVDQVALLKCDVEGSELAVLRGCGALLTRPDAPLLVVEINDEACRAAGYTRRDLWDFLVSQGYDHFYDMVGGRRVRRLAACQDLRGLNLLCAKGQRVAERLTSALQVVGAA